MQKRGKVREVHDKAGWTRLDKNHVSGKPCGIVLKESAANMKMYTIRCCRQTAKCKQIPSMVHAMNETSVNMPFISPFLVTVVYCLLKVHYHETY